MRIRTLNSLSAKVTIVAFDTSHKSKSSVATDNSVVKGLEVIISNSDASARLDRM